MFSEERVEFGQEAIEEEDHDDDDLDHFSHLDLSSSSSSISSSTCNSPHWSNPSSSMISSADSSSAGSDYFSHLPPSSYHCPTSYDLYSPGDISMLVAEEHRSITPTSAAPSPTNQYKIDDQTDSPPSSSPLFNSAFTFGTPTATSSFNPTTTTITLLTPSPPLVTAISRSILPPSPPRSKSAGMMRSFSTPVETQKTLDERRVLLGVVGREMGHRAKRVLSLSSSPVLSSSSLDRSGGSSSGSSMSMGRKGQNYKLFRSCPSTPLRRPSVESLATLTLDGTYGEDDEEEEQEEEQDKHLVFPYNLIVRPSIRSSTFTKKTLLRSNSVTEIYHPLYQPQRQYSTPNLYPSSSHLDPHSNMLSMKRRTMNPLTKIVTGSEMASSGTLRYERGRGLVRTVSS